ncbi:hypothetical protein NM688_g4786 [Phlebia brevispora]|uniref:Uncharacterized protein n=1 Tax=Phlebia brevispora TaxID=194682 RepID=A0ACC1T1M7_9APHY|nr:hypothetical protein NM688_g4786 [Phlebia brevispora]
MNFVLQKVFFAALLLLAFGNVPSQAKMMSKAELHSKQVVAAERFALPAKPGSGKTAKNITFSNSRASEFYVDGTSIPAVDFDVGPSWAGLLPISSSPNETRKLFFWFFPPGPQGSTEDLIFWTNGGPGCSSLEGLLQENGPFSWSFGQAKPTQNQFSWTNLSSILFVEQPVGTGFSQGKPNITNEDELAAQFVGFMQQFLEVFSELKGKNFYASGESYAGMYVPYIVNYIYEHPTALDLEMKGFWISDPVIGWDVIQSELPAVNFVHKYENVFSLNQTFMAQVDAAAERCGYTNYSATHVTFPPKGLLPLPGKSTEGDPGCFLWEEVLDAALIVNPAFDIYRIFDTFPILWDVLGFPGTFEQVQVSPVYFDRDDVKQVIHAPLDVDWTECSNINVFPSGDSSLPSGLTVLPSIIEKSERSVIVHGLADYILISEGTRITIQNMTWAGLQGFQTPILNESFIVDGVGALGNMHSERGLTYFEVALSGHMVPQFSPRVGRKRSISINAPRRALPAVPQLSFVYSKMCCFASKRAAPCRSTPVWTRTVQAIMLSSSSALTFVIIAATLLVQDVSCKIMSKAELHTRQVEAAQRFSIRTGPGASQGVKNITFSNPRASQFYVDGTTIPEVNFDIGPSWSGLLPISSDPNETRQLFFWFFPPGPQGSTEDLIFWTNGGPGCSSLEGLLQENGPFSWSWGQALPTQNEFSWTNLSSVLFVEQPVGTGFSQGVPNITNEDELAAQLVGFLQQFLSVFSELKDLNFYLAGESYAGMYVPYTANYIYEHPQDLDLDLKGIWISDPAIGWDVIQGQVAAANFMHSYEKNFALNQTFMAEVDATAARCGYTSYLQEYLTYPPKGKLPLPGHYIENDPGCDVWTMIFNASLLVNPAFDIYRVFDTYPILWDVLGFPGTFPAVQVAPVYFDREDVKSAIHAPLDVEWSECANSSVWATAAGDSSLPSSYTVLPSVIEQSERSVIVNGLADYLIIAEGTRIVIQNMTWSGKQGFQTPIATDSFIVDDVGALGNMHSERGLTYYEVALSGHMVPQFSPKVRDNSDL